jgi:chaperone modulatory protein CbpM
MPMDDTETLWLESHREITLHELAQFSGLSESEVRDLIDGGAIQPVDERAEQYMFRAQYILAAKAARRLRRDFELDMQGVVVALALLDRVHDLEMQIRALYARVQGSNRNL